MARTQVVVVVQQQPKKSKKLLQTHKLIGVYESSTIPISIILKINIMENVKKILGQLKDLNAADLEQLSPEDAEGIEGGSYVDLGCQSNTSCGPNTGCGKTTKETA